MSQLSNNIGIEKKIISLENDIRYLKSIIKNYEKKVISLSTNNELGGRANRIVIQGDTYYIDSDGNAFFNTVTTDIGGELSNMTFLEQAIKDGEVFQYYERSSSGGKTVTNSSDWNHLITTPNTTKWCHLYIFYRSNYALRLTLFENVTTSSDGSDMSGDIKNKNRKSSTPPTMKIHETPTVTDWGNELIDFGVSKDYPFQGTMFEQKIVLDQNLKYALRLNNSSGSDAQVDLYIFWIEHTD